VPITIPVNVDGGVHEGEFLHMVDDLADPRRWSSLEEPMPEQVQ